MIEFLKIDPNYTYSDLSIYPGNRFAHAAAGAVIKAPGTSYNPLLLFGPDTDEIHRLLHSIGNGVTHILPESKIALFSFDSINKLAVNDEQEMQDFIDKIDSSSVILIQGLDDPQDTYIQILLLNLIKSFHEKNKLVVLTSSLPVENLNIWRQINEFASFSLSCSVYPNSSNNQSSISSLIEQLDQDDQKSVLAFAQFLASREKP